MSDVSVAGLCRALERAGVAHPDSVNPIKPTFVCAVSGGLDSMVLLHLLVSAGYAVRAIHIDHAAHSDSSSWASWVRGQVEALGVTLSVHRLSGLSNNGNLEESWRNARRELFQQECGDETLVTAHHKDDQAETLLLQLLRGAGVAGLQAMPLSQTLPSGTRHVRPLLNHTRAELQVYAENQRIEWIEDPSNQNEHFDRNFLRGSVLPLIRERWPGAVKAIARSSELIGEAADLNAVLAAQDARFSDGDTGLDWSALEPLGLVRQANAVRFWLSRLGCRYPSRRRLTEALRQWNEAMCDRVPVLELKEGTVQRYRNRLVFVRGVGDVPDDWSAQLALGEWIALPGALGELGLTQSNKDRNDPQSICGPQLQTSPTDLSRQNPGVQMLGRGGLALAGELATQRLTVRFRQNGERLRRASGQHQSLKHWFQGNDVPPILRSRLPLVFLGDELIAIANQWIDSRYRPAAEDGAQIFCQLVWRSNDP
ncbi:MAG: tRNA lysidine(34) synthetase TilS [Gammaproteobacteria bacterium]